MYIDRNELINRFGQDELDELVSGLESPVADLRVDTAIADADAVVNSYLSKRYTVPVEATSLVKGFVAHIARFNLYDDVPTETVENKYKSTVSMLKDIAMGKADLAGSASEDPSDIGRPSDALTHVSQGRSGIDWGAY